MGEKTKGTNIPIITILLIAANVLVFLYMEAAGDTESTMFLYSKGAMYVPAVLEGGEWYRVFAHMFIHSGIEHIFNNMLMLGVLGYQMEKEYGRVRFTITYFICGIGATVVSAIPEILNSDYSVSVGASGAIMGLFGAILVMIAKNGRAMGRVSSVPRLIVLFVIMIFGNMGTGIDWMAHLGGALVGVVMALILYHPKAKQKRLSKKRDEK